MKKQKGLGVLFVAGLLLYAFSFIATKRDYPPDPCLDPVSNWFYKDTTLRYHELYSSNNDTTVIKADTLHPVNWNAITDSLCVLYRANCGSINKKILVINTRDTIFANRDTRYGKKLFFKDCQ
jgi:hypothetical protein